MENNRHLVCNEIVSLGKMVQYFLQNDRGLSFFVKYCIQWPFVENMTHSTHGIFWKAFCCLRQKKKVMQEPVPPAHHDQDVMFLEDILLPLTEKMVMQEPVPPTHHDQGVMFLEDILLPLTEKKVMQEPVPPTHHDQDVMFLEDVLLPLMEKKVMQELVPPTHHDQDVMFLEDVLLPLMEKKGDAGAGALN